MWSVAWLSLLIWLALCMLRGGFWRVSKLQQSAAMRPLRQARVVAIIPARNEADVIVESLESLQKQKFEGELSVVVVDDNSTDGTGDVARSAGVTVIRGLALQPGWTGKLWALEQGVPTALALRPDYLLLTDADIHHGEYSVASLLGMAQTYDLDLASHMVKLHCRLWVEKLTIPAFVFFFFKLFPPRWIFSATSKVAGAAGGCILIRPEALSRIGGLQKLKGEIIDDCSLARAVKSSGGKLWLGLTATTHSIRPYSGWSEIGTMISRSAFSQLNHSLLLLVLAACGLLITYIAPALLGLSGSVVALAAWALMFLCYLPMVRFYRLNPVWALMLPVTACFYLGATLHSAVAYWRGCGGNWKGRSQDRHSSAV